jgi:hypothetical protein
VHFCTRDQLTPTNAPEKFVTDFFIIYYLLIKKSLTNFFGAFVGVS